MCVKTRAAFKNFIIATLFAGLHHSPKPFIQAEMDVLIPMINSLFISDHLFGLLYPCGELLITHIQGNAILIICTSAWILCVIFMLIAIFFIPKDIEALHKQLEERAQEAAAA